MKFRIPSANRTPSSGELRIESLGRFGNYFYTSGWIANGGHEAPPRAYQFTDGESPVSPEFSHVFHKPEDGSKTRFVDLFWLSDGHRRPVDATRPLSAGLVEAKGRMAVRRTEVTAIAEDDYQDFLSVMETADARVLWIHRMVFEMIDHCNDGDRAGFYAVAIDRLGWHTVNECKVKYLAESGRDDMPTRHLDFLALCISQMEASYLPPQLKEKFIELSKSHHISKGEHRLTRNVLRELARIDNTEACSFALATITALEHDRQQLADCLRDCFPLDSRWWIHHALINEELGPEQAADTMNCAGTAAASENNAALAALCYEVAMRLEPASQSPAWNAGWLRFESGSIEDAAECFRRVTRHYTHTSLSTRWPHLNNLPWPAAPMDPSRFSLPPGVAEWPRITIVTPSYNQDAYVEETLLSVLNQNYPNLQYIVVDGNSTDGSKAILERYRHRLDHLIIEPDKGQTEAINKGLRLADGELIAWINSDDVYAPGALHMAALHWLRNRADLIAGICIEHIDRRMLLMNRPAASDSEFNPAQLARIFRYWLKGYYFYQPELFFSKRILDKTGLLDESLYYSMDYDLWMRFSKAGASLEVMPWPVAFFRKHEAQKTANLVDCIEEQARVRSRHHLLEPGEERAQRVGRMLAALGRKEKPLVGVLTRRKSKIFSAAVQTELERFGAQGFEFHLSDDENDPRIAGADLVILLAHVLFDEKTIGKLRAARPERPVVAWFWDNHHHLFENHATAEAADVIFPGHAVYGEYLRNDQALYGGHVPLCVTQWARQDVARWFADSGGGHRSEDLYGGFVEYSFEPARTRFLHDVMGLLPQHALTVLSELNLKDYFGRVEQDRFAEWCRYQTSLILPLRNDLSQRVFDALLAGLIPLVPEEIKDLDLVIPRDVQESLPVVRFTMKDPASAVAAWRMALARFKDGGAEAALARHRFALEQHMFSSRINRILDALRDA